MTENPFQGKEPGVSIPRRPERFAGDTGGGQAGDTGGGQAGTTGGQGGRPGGNNTPDGGTDARRGGAGNGGRNDGGIAGRGGNADGGNNNRDARINLDAIIQDAIGNLPACAAGVANGGTCTNADMACRPATGNFCFCLNKKWLCN